jgi:hypothetical protein
MLQLTRWLTHAGARIAFFGAGGRGVVGVTRKRLFVGLPVLETQVGAKVGAKQSFWGGGSGTGVAAPQGTWQVGGKVQRKGGGGCCRLQHRTAACCVAGPCGSSLFVAAADAAGLQPTRVTRVGGVERGKKQKEGTVHQYVKRGHREGGGGAGWAAGSHAMSDGRLRMLVSVAEGTQGARGA